MTPDTCPNCGTEVPSGARACPGCGADERTGWSDDAQTQRLGIPDPEAFDYDGFVARELGQNPPRPQVRWWWWLLAAIGIAAFLWTRVF